MTITEFDQRGTLLVHLTGILDALGRDAMTSRWLVEHVEAAGGMADSMHELSDKKAIIGGEELYRLASSIDQIIDGSFSGLEAESLSPWIVTEAVDSSAYHVTSKKLSAIQQVHL